MKKLVVFLFAVSVLSNISAVFADEPTETSAATADEGNQLPEGVQPLPEFVAAE